MKNFSIRFKKYKYFYDKKPIRKTTIQKIAVRVVLLFLLLLVTAEMNLNNEITEFIVQLIILPSIITLLLVGVFGSITEYLGGDFLKKYVVQLSYKQKKVNVSIFLISMYILVFSIYLYLFLN